MTNQLLRNIFTAAALLGLAGCAAALSEPSAVRSGGVVAARPARPPPVKPPPAKPPAPSAETAAPAKLPPPPSFPPDRLKGLDEAAARRLLGEPAQQAERPPARLWRYETAGCRLALAFYPDVASQSWRVLSYEVTPQGAAPLAGAVCVGQLAGGRTP